MKNIKDILIVIALLLGGIAFVFSIGGQAPKLGGYTAGNWYAGGNIHASGTGAFATTTVTGLTASGALTGTSITASSLVDVDALTFGNASTSISNGSNTSVQLLTAAQVCDNSVIRIVDNRTAGVNLFTPTAVALKADCLATEGSWKDLIIFNDSGTAASSTYLIPSTSIDVVYGASTTFNASTAIYGGESARLRFQHIGGSTPISIFFEIFDQ